MHVTNVWVNKYSSGKMVGFATFRFALTPEGDGCLTIKNFKVFKGNDGGLYVGMPSEKLADGTYKPTVDFFLKNEDAKSLVNEMNQKVMVAFNNADDNAQQTRQNNTQTNQQTNQSMNSGLPF